MKELYIPVWVGLSKSGDPYAEGSGYSKKERADSGSKFTWSLERKTA